MDLLFLSCDPLRSAGQAGPGESCPFQTPEEGAGDPAAAHMTVSAEAGWGVCMYVCCLHPAERNGAHNMWGV